MEAQVVEAAVVAEAAADTAVASAVLAATAPQRVQMMLDPDVASQLTALVGYLSQGIATPPPVVPSPAVPALTTEQLRIALDYDALRTALGRRGAASIVLYRVVGLGDGGLVPLSRDPGSARRLELGIEILHGHIDADWSIVIYGPAADRPGAPRGEIGRELYNQGQGVTRFPGLLAGQHIDRLEVHDRYGRPVRLGRSPQPYPFDEPEIGR